MTSATANRPLAAIMMADVVGYSRMMAADEAGTYAAMEERFHGVLEPTIAMFGGRVVKLLGDGVLVEFASAVHSVQAALDIQAQMAAANEKLPETRRIVLRIGINLGSIALYKEAHKLDPFYQATWYWTSLGAAHSNARQYEQAIAALEHASDGWDWKHALLAASHAQLGRMEEARRNASEVLMLTPNFSIARNMTREPLKRQSDAEDMIAGLRKAGLPE